MALHRPHLLLRTCSHFKCQLKTVAFMCLEHPLPPGKSIHSCYGWKHGMSMLLSAYPACAQELFGYQCLITLVNLQLSFSAWISYNVKFRTLAATCPSLHWDVCHPDLWLECLTISKSPTSEYWPYPHCNSVCHFLDRFPFHGSGSSTVTSAD